MREVFDGEEVVARLIRQDDIKEGLSFFSKDFESLQVGAWEHSKDTLLPRHIHKIVPRTFQRTNETLVVMFGEVDATIYSLDGDALDSFTVHKGEILILLNCGHGYYVHDGTQVIEIKNGPYPGAEQDRERF